MALFVFMRLGFEWYYVLFFCMDINDGYDEN